MSRAEHWGWSRLASVCAVLSLGLAESHGPYLPERFLPLTPNTIFEAALKGGESHRYRIELPPGQFADLVVEQRGVDVALRLAGPDGRVFPEVDTPNGKEGPEPLPLLGAAGPFRLEIHADPQSPPGRYAVRIGEVRPATRRDRDRVAAERDFAAAKSLKKEGTGESLRAAKAGVEKAVSRFKALGAAGREAEALYALGRIRDGLGETEAARGAFTEARRGFHTVGERSGECRALNSLGPILLNLGIPQEALARGRDALALTRSLGNPRVEATALNNIGRAQAALGHSEEAFASYEQALALWRRLGSRIDESRTLTNRARLFIQLGDNERALDDLDQALPLAAGLDAAEALNERGYLLSRTGRPDEAATDLAKAMGLYRQSGDRQGEAVALSNLGQMRLFLGDNEGAMGAFQKVVATFRELGDSPDEGAALVTLGRIRLDVGDLSGAEAAFQHALRELGAIGSREGEAAAWMGIAQVRRERGELRDALNAANTGLSRLETLRAEPASPESRISFFAPYQDAFSSTQEMAMELHRREPAGGYDVQALEVAERSRARTLLDSLARSDASPGSRAETALPAHEAVASERLEMAEKQRQALVEAGAPSGQVAAAKRELRRLLADVERRDARRITPAADSRPLTVREIQRQALGPEVLLLEYALGEHRSFLWAVSSHSVKSYELPPRKTLEDAARRAHDLLSDRRRTLALAPAREALAELSRLVLGPVKKELVARRLVVVPDGALHLIPFGALPDPTSPGQPLLARCEVVTIPSSSSLAAIRRGAAGRKPAPAVIAVLADPVFDVSDPRLPNRGKAVPPRTGKQRFPRLPFSREEARIAVALAPPGERRVDLDFAARREEATSGILERFRIVHFATHAVVDSERPDLSGIALSMVDERGRPREGFLRVYEIDRLHLAADLVVLSACETALGKDVRGEGVVGLTRAFLHAGARRVLVSLWPVEDRPTADLMRLFYSGLFRDGLTPAAALRRAQDELRRQPNRQSPHDWAGFVLQGDWS